MNYLEIAKSLALRAGEMMTEGQKKGFDVKEKSLADFVTNIDIEIEQMVRDELARLTPDILVLGEEKGDSDWQEYEEAEMCWVLDPVDGTANFASKLPHYAFSLGLLKNSKPIVGVVFDTREMFFAEKGSGAFLQRLDQGGSIEEIKVSNKTNSKNSMLAVGVPELSKEYFEEHKFWYSKLVNNFGKIRSLGACALDISWVASGRLEAYFIKRIKPWDVCASSLIALEAGAIVKSIDGNDLVDFSVFSGNILVSNPHIFKAIFD